MMDPKLEREKFGANARARLFASGMFGSAVELLRSHPNQELVELVKPVAGLTAYDLSRLLRIEVKSEDLEWMARRLLVGELRRYLKPTGWPAGRDPDSLLRYIGALLSWKDFVGSDLRVRTDAVEGRLLALGPPQGWMPQNVDDPLLAKAFEVWTDI